MKEGLVLWLLVFAAPVAWFVDLEANLAFSTQVCSGAWAATPAVVSVIALIVSGAAGTLLWNRFRTRQTQPPTGPVYRIVAIAGALLSLAFVVVIIAESIPVMMLRNCQ